MSYQQLPVHETPNFTTALTPGGSPRQGGTPHTNLPPLRGLSATDPEKTESQKRRYIYSGLALLIALVTFVVQTEAAGYLAMTLKYKKPIFMLYITHSSWTLLWPLQILFLRIVKWNTPFKTFFRSHMNNVLSTANMINDDNTGAHKPGHHRQPSDHRHLALPNLKDFRDLAPAVSPLFKILKKCLVLTAALTVAGMSWYIAINMTTTSDITAIYNCSAFFAYAFSVPLLNDPFRLDKSFSVVLAMIGVFIVAYGGGSDSKKDIPGDEPSVYPHRMGGNLVIGVGAVLYGLYEVLYKKITCPPSTVSPRRQAVFANVVGTGIGLCTFSLVWLLLPILHFTGIEPFEAPRGEVLQLLVVSILSNMLFSGSMLVLMSLTSPVLSSVAALLTIFIVAIVDWFFFSVPISFAGFVGGLMIIIAFLLLSYATWKELCEEDDSEIENEYRTDFGDEN